MTRNSKPKKVYYDLWPARVWVLGAKKARTLLPSIRAAREQFGKIVVVAGNWR